MIFEKLSNRQALWLFGVAITGFAGWLYLMSFAWILYQAIVNGEIRIRPDALLPSEIGLIICVSNSILILASHTILGVLHKEQGNKKE